jgi:precorrin-3B C17-methyltransferase
LPSENKLFIVGLGPGGQGQLSLRAAQALDEADFIVGYSTYLDLLGRSLEGKQVASSSMGKEVDRASKAVDLLDEGTVALISSGDPNIYGMAGLGLEMASKRGYIDQVDIIPGVTSFTAAACRSGAVFRESVAIIILSDLLTPWQKIADRLKLAAELQMPTALYNPKSRKRDWQLEKALEMRSPEEDILLARNISRPGESLKWTKARDLLEDEELKDSVDMFTLVIIGGRGMIRGNVEEGSNVKVVGIGPGDMGQITFEAQRILQSSSKVFGAQRYIDGIREAIRGEPVFHQGTCAQRIARRLEEAKSASEMGLTASILTGGDPSIFSSAWRILEGAGDAKVQICPGISAFSAVAARAGAPLVNDFALLSGANNPSNAARLAAAGFGVVIYNADGTTIPGILSEIDPSRPCAIAQDVARADERIMVMTAGDLLKAGPSGSRLTLIVASDGSMIFEGRIITRRGYQTRYIY